MPCYRRLQRRYRLIQLKGLKDYKVPSPVVIQPAVNTPAIVEIEQSEDDEDNSYDLDIEPEEEKVILSFDDQENIPKDVELEQRNLFDFIEYNYLKKLKELQSLPRLFSNMCI